MDTAEAPAAEAAEPSSPAPRRSLHAALWGALAYPVGAFLWACAAAGASATEAPHPGLAGIAEWFGWSLLWILVLTVAAAPIGLPLAVAETFLWELAAARLPVLERRRWGLLAGAAVLALPWAFLVPWVLAEWMKGPVPAVVAYACALLGFALPRLIVRPLGPGALLGRRRGPAPAA
jgi:hypothetical protein